MKLHATPHFVCWILIAVGFQCASLLAAEPPTTPAPRELLSQFVNIDQPDFKAKGKIALHRLQPLAGQLILSEAHGNPDWIFKTIAPWNSQVAKFLQQIKIKELTLADGDLLLDGQLIKLRLNKATIPEGWVENVNYQVEDNRSWNLQTARLRLDRAPDALQSFLLMGGGAMGFDRLQATGNWQTGQGWAEGVFGQGWRIGRLEGNGEVGDWNSQGKPGKGLFSWQATKVALTGLQSAATHIPALADLLRYAGKNPDKQEPLQFDQVKLELEDKGGPSVRIKNVRMDSGWLEVWGEGSVEKKSQQVTLNLTAKTPKNNKKLFKLHFPISALVQP